MGYSTLIMSVIVYASILQVHGKFCTNVMPDDSHTLRYEISTSKNATWKKEMIGRYNLASNWGSPVTRTKKLMELGASKQSKSKGGILEEISLHEIRLEPGSKHWRAQETNLNYLLWLDVDSLVWSFRKNAGLETPSTPYGGWEAPDVQLRGHFVGHYMSATARMWASTHNEIVKKKMSYVVSALKECQDKLGTGYLSAFPDDYFDRIEALEYAWAPYYTIHKIMAGLLDQYTFCRNTQALNMLNRMVEYFHIRVQNVIEKYSIERHWMSLNEEVGGMNDVLYHLYSITGNQKHLWLAHMFDKPCFLGILAMKADDISGFHANTHIPLVVGAQSRYEVTGDELYREIGTYFMDIVNKTHSYATGGTSCDELWSEPNRLGSYLGTETQESCTTYNMLKVSRSQFRWTRDTIYADYYERAVTNGLLSIQRGEEPGIMIYMLPLGHGVSKAETFHGWGTKNDSFWCCYGTGIETFSKLGDSIYFEERGKVPRLYVIQYVASSLNWRSGKISLMQKVRQVASWDQLLRVTFIVSSITQVPGTSTLNLRVPSWTRSRGASASLNGHQIALPNPGSFLFVTRNWKDGDRIELELPLTIRTEAIEDDREMYSSLHAIFYGPYLLAGLSDGEEYNIRKTTTTTTQWITPVPAGYNSQLISLSQEGLFMSTTRNYTITMEPSPQDGTDATVHVTFRVVDVGPKLGMLEPMDQPGMVVSHSGPEKGLIITNVVDRDKSVFRFVNGLDGSVSLELKSKEGCFVSTGDLKTTVKLVCGHSDRNKTRTSFKKMKGLRPYNPISFIAQGKTKNYLLEPLFSLRDEFYNVYFSVI